MSNEAGDRDEGSQLTDNDWHEQNGRRANRQVKIRKRNGQRTNDERPNVSFSRELTTGGFICKQKATYSNLFVRAAARKINNVILSKVGDQC